MDFEHIPELGHLIAFNSLKNKSFDLYCYPGHPAFIHDTYGALAVGEFYNSIITELLRYSTEVYRADSAVFAVPSSEKNPPSLFVKFKTINYILPRRRITINNVWDAK